MKVGCLAAFARSKKREWRRFLHLKGKAVRLLSLLIAAALCLSMLMVPASASSGVTVWSSAIGGHTAKLVSVAMGNGRTGEISLANNSVVESTAASTLINQKNNQTGTHVVAAINGGFFNSYTSGSWSYPNNCPIILNTVVTNGKAVMTGINSTIGFTADGKVMVDWVNLGSEIRLGNGATVSSGYGINTYHSEPEAIMLFNEHLTLPVTIPSSSTMVFIQDKKVTKVMAGEKLWVPKGVDVLVYNSAAAELYKSWDQFPEVGMSADIGLTASGTTRDTAWTGIETAVAGGPLLVKNGVNVVKDARNNPYYSDPKQKPDAVLSRSFLGVTANGGLVMGTVTASFNQIANWMVNNGIVEGISMDGGASSMLYADGSGFVTSAGRNLASALVIVDRTGNGGLPTESNLRSPYADVPSGWASADVQRAISLGLVPKAVQGNYAENISRRDFCLLIWELVKKQPDYLQKLYSRPEVSFTDAKKDELLWVARLGIVNGYEDGSFKQYNLLTRAEAAKILAVTTQLLGVEDTGEPFGFADAASFGWARPYIDFCGVHGIINGVGNNTFSPKGNFTRQQAIVTILRIYEQYGK